MVTVATVRDRGPNVVHGPVIPPAVDRELVRMAKLLEGRVRSLLVKSPRPASESKLRGELRVWLTRGYKLGNQPALSPVGYFSPARTIDRLVEDELKVLRISKPGSLYRAPVYTKLLRQLNLLSRAVSTVANRPPGTLVSWVLGPFESCLDCVRLNKLGPYQIRFLPTVPLGMDTRCGMKCQCKLDEIRSTNDSGPRENWTNKSARAGT